MASLCLRHNSVGVVTWCVRFDAARIIWTVSQLRKNPYNSRNCSSTYRWSSGFDAENWDLLENLLEMNHISRHTFSRTLRCRARKHTERAMISLRENSTQVPIKSVYQRNSLNLTTCKKIVNQPRGGAGVDNGKIHGKS